MANLPRKPASRLPQERPAPKDDLFGEDAVISAPPPAEPSEEWDLEDAPSASLPPRPRITTLPAQPIPAGPGHDFESNSKTAPLQAVAAPPVVPPTFEAAPVHETEVVDPFQIDDDLPVVAPAPAPLGEKNLIGEPPGEMESPGDTDSADASDQPVKLPTPGQTKASLLTAAGLLVALVVVFGGIIYSNRLESNAGNSRATPNLPLNGTIVTVSELTSGWRERQPSDRVSTVEVTLPSPSRVEPSLLPQVEFTSGPGSGQTGFLRFIFLDPDGKISGDVRVLKMAGGSIDPLNSGAILKSPNSAIVYGSLGFMDRPGFVGYATSSVPRWSVEVSESTDYNAKEEEWTRLDTFDVRDRTGTAP